MSGAYGSALQPKQKGKRALAGPKDNIVLQGPICVAVAVVLFGISVAVPAAVIEVVAVFAVRC